MDPFTFFILAVVAIIILILIFKKIFKLALILTLLAFVFAYTSPDFLGKLKKSSGKLFVQEELILKIKDILKSD